MLKFPPFPAVASSRRRTILPPLATVALFGSMLLATGLLAFGSITSSASAEPYCDGADPPPICDPEPPPPPDPPPPPPDPPPPPADLSLTATSWHGSVTTLERGPTESRYAASGNSIQLSAGSLANRITITEAWSCGWQGAGPSGTRTKTTPATVRQYTVADFELRCQDGPETVPPQPSTRGLDVGLVIAVAYNARDVPTGQLEIWVLGNQFPDDWKESLLTPWAWPPSP